MNHLSLVMRCLLLLTITLSVGACGGGEGEANAPGETAGPDDVSTAGPGSAGGANPAAPSTDLTGKMLDEMEALTEVLKGVKDEASAQAAAQYITEYAERKKTLAEQFKALSTAEQIADSQKHAKRNMDVNMALHQETMRINLDPALKKYLAEAFEMLK